MKASFKLGRFQFSHTPDDVFPLADKAEEAINEGNIKSRLCLNSKGNQATVR